MAHRLAGLFLAAVVSSLLIFLALHILPGDAATVLAGDRMTAAEVDSLRERLGLTEPLIFQYLRWLQNFFSGNLGVSPISGRPVFADLATASGVTVSLTVLALLFTVLFGVALPIGLFLMGRKAQYKGSFSESVFLFISSIPALWMALLALAVFGTGVGLFGVFPVSAIGRNSGGFSVLVLPALVCGVISGARLFRFTKLQLEESGTAVCDYSRNFAAIGYTRKAATIKSGFRAHFTPIVSATVLTGAELLTGVVVLEKLFVLKGVGSMLMKDVLARDLLSVQSEVFLLVLLVLAVGFILDLVVGVIDPRARAAGLADHALGVKP